MKSSAQPNALATAIGLVLVAWSAPAQPVGFELNGDIASQAYDVTSPWGERVLRRRRLLSTLGLAAWNLQGAYHPSGPDYSLQLRFRFDADFGLDRNEESYTASRTDRFVPGLGGSPVDLLYGYLEGRNLLGGLLGFRLGRQTMSDVLGWWSFDGGLVQVTTPLFLRAEVYGGLEKRGGMPLSSPRYEPQGVWRGARTGFEANAHDYPSYQLAGHAPAFGVALETNGPNWIHGRLDYRRVYNSGAAFTGQFGGPTGDFEQIDELRLSQERFGYAISAFLPEHGGIRGGFAYDIYNDLISRGYVGMDAHFGKRLTVGADVDYYVPTFDADSIWNWFSHNGNISALARLAARPTERLKLNVSVGTRVWMTDGDPDNWALRQCGASVEPAVAPDQREAAIAACMRYGIDASSGSARDFARDEENRETQLAPDLLANLGGSYRWSSGHLRLGASLQSGFGGASVNRGRRVGGTLWGRQAIVPDQLDLRGQISTYDWTDPLRPDRAATSFGYMLAPNYWLTRLARLSLEWEHNMNRLVGQRFRIVGLLSLRLEPSPETPARTGERR